MKLEEATKVVNEAITKTEREKPSPEEKKDIKTKVWLKLNSGDFKIKLRPERCEDVEYIARMINDKLMQKDAMTAAGLAYNGESPTFDERIKAQNKFKNEHKRKVENYCKTELINTIGQKNVSDFVDKLRDRYQIVFKMPGSSTFPYTKFDYFPKTGDLNLISCHDSKFSFKKKSYNDTSSYKFGNREALNKVKQDMEKNLDKF